MKITITGRQMTVRESLKELVQTKLAKYDRFFEDSAQAQVTFSCRHGKEMIEITVVSNGTIFRAEEGADTFRTALDSAMDALERQIRKNKTRLEKRMRQGAYAAIDYIPEPHAEEETLRIRTKTYPVRPMSVEEAAMQMDLLGHQFFVFVDQESEKTCVVYKRYDGEYGLIIPE